MAMLENQAEGGSNSFADDGTASHNWGAYALTSDFDADIFIGETLVINDKPYEMDETRASFVQVYLDDVRRRAIGGMLFVEYAVDISEILGDGQGGTADAVILLPAKKQIIVEDLKYGTGEKVYAQIDGEINPQLGLYLLGVLKDMALLGHDVETVTGVICQPRLGHLDEHTLTVSELYAFARKAREAVALANIAMVQPDKPYLTPGAKQCRWCRAKANCPALTKFVAEQVRCDFDTIQSEPPPIAPRDTNLQ
jgi:hypothetical protein